MFGKTSLASSLVFHCCHRMLCGLRRQSFTVSVGLVGDALDEIIAVRQQIIRRQVVRMGQNLARWYSPTLLYTHAIAEVGERWLMRSP